MQENRIRSHPILDIPAAAAVAFRWNGRRLYGLESEMIASALIANGIHIFGHHPKDHSPQGIFCANGQCSQCMVMVDGRPVKSCMTPLKAGMDIRSVEGRPKLPELDAPAAVNKVPVTEVDVLIIGAGPAGLSAAIELGSRGISTLIVDDKDRLGGKLVLQTHKFFGSVEDSYAGTRGFEIAGILAEQIHGLTSVDIWLQSTAVGIFSDGVAGIDRPDGYRMVKPRKLLVATGAREKMLSFPGNTLPGIYGAGAFQTLVNRDLVKSSAKVLIVGGGNVGLIAGYHAIQAGIDVVALIEALPRVGGYKVHADKLLRLGVPIFTRHTVLSVHGKDHVDSVAIARLDDQWQPIAGTEKTYSVDTVLIAVGLAEVNEFYHKARQWGMDVFCAGDAQEIAEASAAMFTGKIEGVKIAQSLGVDAGPVPAEWSEKAAILKARPGTPVRPSTSVEPGRVFPIFHCYQEVPCNPCTSVCPVHAVHTRDEKITGLPYRDTSIDCTGCLNCVAVCPGLAVSLVDYRQDADAPVVTLPYEMWRETVTVGRMLPITREDGAVIGRFPVVGVKTRKKYPGTLLVQVKMEKHYAEQAAGIWVQEQQIDPSAVYEKGPLPDEAIVCRCERVSAGEIRRAIRAGMTDMNQIKALTRAGMGACGSKTCRPMIWRLFQEEGVDLGEVIDRVDRPLFVEVPIGHFAGVEEGVDHESL